MKVNFHSRESRPAFKGCSVVKSNKHIPTSVERDMYFLRGMLKRINPENINPHHSYLQQNTCGTTIRATFQNGKALRISPALVTYENGKKIYCIKIPFHKNEENTALSGLLTKLTKKLSETLIEMTQN